MFYDLLRLLKNPFADPCQVNDPHSRLNQTRVARVARPENLSALQREIQSHSTLGKPLSICGSRHSMGGQQFLAGETLLDMRRLNLVLDLDVERGIVTTEAGIEWPDLVERLHRRQTGVEDLFTIPTKQTGADKLTLGGAISVNAHGRGLTRRPISADIESLQLVHPTGSLVTCSRTENEDLFRCVVGGYGLFGPIYSVRMKLERRHKLQRIVEVNRAEALMPAFEARTAEGFTLGDWQFAIDEESDDFLKLGVFSCYKPVSIDTPIAAGQKNVSKRVWNELVYLAHHEKSRAFELYADYYLSSSGQIYWSDTSQLGGYEEGYHEALDRRLHSKNPATEMITELYVPRNRFVEFMNLAADSIRKNKASVIYGTVRLIEKDLDSLIPWAKEDFACIIFNIHVEHTEALIEQATTAFRELIDIAIKLEGSFYLTYHRWAIKTQIDACYSQFAEFLAKKKQYDSKLLFQSDWYRHMAALYETNP